MKKYLKYLGIFIFTLLLSYGCFFSKPVIADSGFDSSWSGGGSSSWGGSSSYDHSWSSHSYSSSSDGGSVDLDAKQVGFIFDYIASIILIYILIMIYRRNHSKLLLLVIILYTILALIVGYILMETAALVFYFATGLVGIYYFIRYLFRRLFNKIDSAIGGKSTKEYFEGKYYASFNTKELQDELFNIYKDIQLAWAQNDIEPVRNILTDELFNNYKMQIDTMVKMKQRNVMDDITFGKMNILDITRKNNIEQVTVAMEVTCKDYLVEVEDGKEHCIKGYANAHMKYLYKMTFVRNITKVTTECPNCGNKLDNAMSTKCDNCGGIVIHETDHFVLSKKEMINQEVK